MNSESQENSTSIFRTSTFDTSQLNRPTHGGRRPLSALFLPKKHSAYALDKLEKPQTVTKQKLEEEDEDLNDENKKSKEDKQDNEDPWLKGDKYNGFDVLQHNFKLGLNASKEFAEFLKEKSSIEEAYSKSLFKLAAKCATANSHVGIFEPCWKFLQSSTEKLANAHTQIIIHLNEVGKEVREYSEQQKDQQKRLKDDFVATSEAVLNLQNLSVALLKAKELYLQRSQEVEKYRKDITNLKDIKNAETKYKKSTEEYKQLVDKRENARKDFHEKMTGISQKLQKVEENHLMQMLDLLSKYGESIKAERFLLDKIIEEFGRNMVALTVENLLQQFINLKQTGKDIPVPVNFEEIRLETQPIDLDAIAHAMKEEKQKRKKEKREKRAERKTKKDKVTTNGSVEKPAEKDVTENQPPIELDEEGYVIRKNSDSIGKMSKDEDDEDESDFDSDSDDEQQKIQVRIKPVDESKKESNPDLTDEQLKKLTTTLTLMSPASVQQKMQTTKGEKKLAWGSQGNLNKMVAKSRSNNDLLNMDKNSDTASLHSLPMNSSIPALDVSSVNSSSDSHLGASGNFDASMTSSPVPSPMHNSKEFLGSANMSPAESMDKSVDSVLGTQDDAPPPLPMKTRGTSLDPSGGSLSNSSDSLNAFKTSSGGEEGKGEPAASLPEINMFTNKLFVEDPVDKSKSLPANMKSSGLGPLKPPPSEKRSGSVLRPPASGSSSKALSGNGTSVPRPKAGQLVAPPPSVTSRRTTSTSTLPTLTTTNITGISSLSDLLDINFSTTAPTLTPLTEEKENTTSHWINPDLTSEISSENISTQPTTSSTITKTSTSSANSSTTLESTSSVTSTIGSSFTPPVVPQTPLQPTPTASSVTPPATSKSSFEANSTPPALPRRNTPTILSPNTGGTAPLNPVPAHPPPSASVDRAIPIAVAFIETVNGVFKGADEKSCNIRVTGDMTISFPANIITMLSSNSTPPVLSFLVNGTASLEQIFPNKALVERGGQLPGGEGMTFKFNMAALAAYLKKQSEQGAKASYYNIDILKYQVRCSGMSSAPLQLSAYWRCDNEQTDLKIDYKYNSACMSSPVALNNVSVVVPVDGGVTIMQSKPTAIWSSEHQRCMWKVPGISSNSEEGNALRARFDITRGPTNPVPIAVQFTGEGSTISLLNFDLTSNAYKLSLVKKRFATGKYIVESR